MASVLGSIARRTPIIGPDNSSSQISADEWNAPLVVDSTAPDGSLIVRDRTMPDGWGFATQLPDNIGVPATRKVNDHMLVTDIWVTAADVGLGNVENVKLSTWGGSNAIATVGIITTGTWRGSVIQGPYGGTGSAFVQFTGPTSLHTYLLPNMDATIFSTASPVPVMYGGTGVQTGLTQLDAYNLTMGIVPDARLSGNVARRDQPANIPWVAVDKTGSSLADLTYRSAADLNFGILDPARLPPGVVMAPIDLANADTISGRLPFRNIQQINPLVLLGQGGGTLGDISQLSISTGFSVVGSTISVQMVTGSLPGLMPSLNGEPTMYLNGTGQWSTPSGTGGGGGTGSGDVVGPTGAVTDHIATYSGSSGKVIKDGGSTISQVVATAVSQATGDILPIDLTSDVTGVLPIGNGGTGTTTGFPSNVVVGPPTAGDSNVTLFDGVSGKLVKDSTVLFTNIARRDTTNTFTGTQTIQPAVGGFSSLLSLTSKHVTGGTPAGTTELLSDEFGATLLYTPGRVRLLASTSVEFGSVTGPTIFWSVSSAGLLLAGSDNLYDIGTAGSGRPRNVYIAGTLTTNAATVATLTVTNVTASGAIAGGTLSGSTLTTTGAITSGGDVLINKSLPQVRLSHNSGLAKVHLAQVAPNTASLAFNAMYDGSNWNLDDTAQKGVLLHMVQGGVCSWYYFVEGANPRTPSPLMTVDPNFLTVNENVLVTKLRPEVQMQTTSSVAKARIYQHVVNALVLTNNASYDGTAFNLDDTAAAAMLYQHSGATASWYYFTAGANPRPAVQLMGLDSNQLNCLVNVNVNKAIGQVTVANPGGLGRAHMLQHAANGGAMWTYNMDYNGNWIGDDAAQHATMVHQHGAGWIWYYAPATAGVRSLSSLMSLDNAGNLYTAGRIASRQLVTLVDAATITIDASTGSFFRIVAGASRTLAAPTSPTDGQRIMIEHYASGGTWTLTLNTAGGGFRFGQDFTTLLPTQTNRADYITCVYSALYNFWQVVGVTKGF